MSKSSDNKDKNSSILRALEILKTVSEASHPITPTEINRGMNLPKPTIHRLCSQLEEEGFLKQLPGSRGLIPGAELNKIALGVLTNNDFLRSQRHVILQNLSKQLGETCNISVPSGGEMIYFDRVETHWPLRVQLQINDRVPLHCTASGKLFLSELPSIKRTRLLAKLPLTQYTENTLTSPEQLKPELRKIKEQGIGIDNEEFLQGMVAVSVPIRDQQGNMYAALAVHGPTARFTLDQALNSVPLMREASAELAALLDEDNYAEEN